MVTLHHSLPHFSVVEKGAVGGRGEGRAPAPVSDIHAPRFPGPRKPLDEAVVVFSQAEAHQQHLGPAWPCKTPSYVQSQNNYTMLCLFFSLLNACFALLPTRSSCTPCIATTPGFISLRQTVLTLSAGAHFRPSPSQRRPSLQ